MTAYPAEARSLAQASLQLQPSAPYRRRVGRRRHVRVIYVGPQIRRGQWTGRVVVWHVDTKRTGACHPNRLHPPLPAKAAEAKP